MPLSGSKWRWPVAKRNHPGPPSLSQVGTPSGFFSLYRGPPYQGSPVTKRSPPPHGYATGDDPKSKATVSCATYYLFKIFNWNLSITESKTKRGRNTHPWHRRQNNAIHYKHLKLRCHSAQKKQKQIAVVHHLIILLRTLQELVSNSDWYAMQSLSDIIIIRVVSARRRLQFSLCQFIIWMLLFFFALTMDPSS